MTLPIIIDGVAHQRAKGTLHKAACGCVPSGSWKILLQGNLDQPKCARCFPETQERQ